MLRPSIAFLSLSLFCLFLTATAGVASLTLPQDELIVSRAFDGFDNQTDFSSNATALEARSIRHVVRSCKGSPWCNPLLSIHFPLMCIYAFVSIVDENIYLSG